MRTCKLSRLVAMVLSFVLVIGVMPGMVFADAPSAHEYTHEYEDDIPAGGSEEIDSGDEDDPDDEADSNDDADSNDEADSNDDSDSNDEADSNDEVDSNDDEADSNDENDSNDDEADSNDENDSNDGEADSNDEVDSNDGEANSEDEANSNDGEADSEDEANSNDGEANSEDEADSNDGETDSEDSEINSENVTIPIEMYGSSNVISSAIEINIEDGSSCTGNPGGVSFSFPNFTNQFNVNVNSTVNFRVHAHITNATRAANFTEMRFEWRRNGEIWQGSGGTGSIPASDIVNPGFGNLYLQLQGPLTQEERGGEWKLCVIIIGADGSEIFRDCTHTVTLTIRTPGGNNNNNNDDNDNDDNDNDNDNDNDGNEPWWPVLPPPSPTLTVLSNDDIRIFVNGYGFPLNQPTRVQNGTQITLTFNAPSGYRLESATFSIGELTSQNSENGQYTLVFTMPNFNTEVTLVFEPISGSLPNNDFPLHWPSDSGEVTLWFGIVDSVYRAVHEGIDIQNILGTPVYSVADGVISDIYDSPLGRVIVTDFTFNGRDMQARHINVDAITVRIGDTVTRGQTIGVKGLNPSHEEIVKGKLEIQLLNADGQKVDPMNFMIRPYYDVDYLTRPMAYSMLPTNRARAYLTTLDMHRRFMANLDLNQDLGEVYLWRAAYNFVISQKDHITPDEFAEAGYLAWDGETRTATFQFQDIFMQWSAPIVEVSEIETWGVTPVADDVGIGRIENDRMIISPNPFVTFRYDVEWRMFSHPETDTEMFISTERLPSFGDFENVFVGVTRFLGNPYGNIYVLDGGEWYLQGSVLLVDIGIVGIQERILPPMLLPPMLVRWVRNTIIGNAQDDVDNPFMDDYFGEFAWKKLLALSASTTSHEAALQVKELTLPMSSLRSSAMITQEQLDRIEEWMMEWEAELVAESHSEEIMPLHTIGLSLDVTRTLSSADGVGDIRFALTAENGLNAQITAAIFYNDTDYAMREDAFRHWYWNFSTAIDLMLGTRVAHVITTNHEWTGRLIGRVTEYYNNELDNLDWWQTSMTARRRALAFSENERNNELELIGSNFNAFTSFFTDEDIMDFYNNEVGRVDAVTYRWSLSTVFTIFGNAWNDGRLVKTYRQEYIAGYGYRVREGGVTYEIQRAVFDNNWWRN